MVAFFAVRALVALPVVWSSAISVHRAAVLQQPEVGREMVDHVPLGEAHLHHFIVLPEYKVLFCSIPMAGERRFRELFRRIRTREANASDEDLRLRSSPKAMNISTHQLRNMMVDSSWHKAVFFVDPAQRFADFFTSYCYGIPDDLACLAKFEVDSQHMVSSLTIVGDDDGIESSSPEDISWIEMGDHCGGLHKTLRYYNTVEELNDATAQQTIAEFLVKVGVTDPRYKSDLAELFPRYREHAQFPSKTKPWMQRVAERHLLRDYTLFFNISKFQAAMQANFQKTQP